MEREARVNQAVSDLSLNPLIVTTGEGVIVSFSKSAARTFGFEATEVIGQNVKMLMPQETADNHDGYLAAFRNRPDAATINVRRTVRPRRKNGEEFRALIIVQSLMITDGGRERMLLVGYLEDITQREDHLLDMRITESATSLASVPVVSMSPQGIVRSFNAAAEATFGYTAAEVIGQNVKMLMPEDIATKHDGFLRRYAETGVKTVIGARRDVPAKRKDGSTFPVVISVHEIKTAHMHHFVGYIEDQTQAHALFESRGINEAARIGSSDPFVTMDDMGIITDVNPACTAVFGYGRHELVGQNVKIIVAEPHRSHHDQYLARYRETGIAKVLNTTTRALLAQRKDGTTTTVDLQVREVSGGGKRYFIGSFREVTREALKQGDRAIALAAERGCVKPLITIDHVGSILRMNQAAVTIFGYGDASELVGKNVKVLMPRVTADQHDGYLKRYRETGVKHVIDSSRQVTGQKKNGSQVEVRLSVRQVTVDCTQDNKHIDFSLMGSEISTQTIFVATLEDVAAAHLALLSGVLNEAVMQLLPTPVITIDERGKILTFNRAAEQAFEFHAAQVVGKNVNLLMPSDVQRKHDSYLARYKATRIKTVIDTTRDVMGETKTGKPLHCQLQVRELRRPRPGQRASGAAEDAYESVYVGFLNLRDTSEAGREAAGARPGSPLRSARKQSQ
jgi:PAS domain S-box-containing protein